MDLAFQNPTGYWEYDGGYSVELTEDADTSFLSLTGFVEVVDSVVTVERGRIKQTMGGVQLYAGDSSFHWGYRFIKRIRKADDGSMIWQNSNHENM